MILTGIQPTGSVHLGNYLGAIKPLLTLQNTDEDTYVFVADYHAITADFDPKQLRANSLSLATILFAAGFDPNRGVVFRQSDVPAHVELAHILACTAARFGQLNRMTTFREKMDNLAESAPTPSLGMFGYPVLQAADILCYQDPEGAPTKVPVGSDQSQHLNLVVDIANSFNHRFGHTFIIPEAVISPVRRVMSLTDASKKMSKSDPDEMSRINLLDAPEVIQKKIKNATSDIPLIPATVEELEGRRELTNLLTIYAAMSHLTLAEAVDTFAGKGYGKLKPALADAIIAGLEPIQNVYNQAGLFEHVEKTLKRGGGRIAPIADYTVQSARRAIGIDMEVS